MYYHSSSQKGFSLVEAMIVAAVSVVVFGALISAYHYSFKLMSNSRAKLSSLSVANDRMEFFRSLPYDSVGVIAGYPAGTIPQNSTTTLNGIEFIERVRVDYVDDPADGIGGADSNGIVLDYKQIRLQYTWEMNGATSSIQLISNIVPRSIETTTGGGTARINVLNADATLLPGATVRLFSSSSTFSYDVTKYTDLNGEVLFNVPADSGYQVEVTANISGHLYSTDQTYVADASNPNPIVAPFSVLEADISTLTFQIGELSDLTVHTHSNINEGALLETFSDMLAVDSSTAVETVGGALVLTNTAGTYDTSGTAYLGPITPSPLMQWETLRVAAALPANTTHRVQFFTGVTGGPYVLIPDGDLPGNGVGFTGTINDISALDPVTYPALFVGVTLETSDTGVTPSVDEVSVYYRQSVTVLPSIAFDIHGDKIIGTDSDAAPIYKYTDSLVTNGAGNSTITDAEFGTYTITVPATYDIATACPAHPVVHQAGVDGDIELVLVSNAASTLRVSVVDSLGRVIPGASVHLTRPGYDVTIVTNTCGQAFFTGGVSDNADYVIAVTATGYNSGSVPVFEISGDTKTSITLTE